MAPTGYSIRLLLHRAAWSASLAALAAGSAGAQARSGWRIAEAAEPPATAPGAAPSASRLVGTWIVMQAQGGPADGRGDHSESTTYRFEEGGRVTVAGAKQCAYMLERAELKVDCNGKISAGRLEFRDAQTMVWTVGATEKITLAKR